MTAAAPPSRRKPRVRPVHQSAQVILRMHPDERAVIHELAETEGASTVRFLLRLAAAEAARRGVGDPGVVAGMFQNAESPDPGGRGSHAEARHAMPVAVELTPTHRSTDQ